MRLPMQQQQPSLIADNPRFTNAGDAFAKLCRILATLRAPGGCAWDRKQTLDTLKAHLLEETFEALDALDQKDLANLREELGDVLLQIVFQSEICHEDNTFSVTDVIESICSKLIRRHPHVFGDKKADSAEEALTRWEDVKALERLEHKKPAGALHGVPRQMPALLRAYRTSEKAAAVGFDWPDADDSKAKIYEELLEIEEARCAQNADALEDEVGDTLFALVNYARHLGVEPEAALRRTIQKFHDRFEHMEHAASQQERTLKDMTLPEMDVLWEQAKRLSRKSPH